MDSMHDGWLIVGGLVCSLVAAVPVLVQALQRYWKEQTDPVAEARVYLAYGCPALARKVLAQALQRDPGNTAVQAELASLQGRSR